MGFLLRCGFWFSLVLLMLPLDGGDNGPKAGALQTFLAAREAISDISGLCDRKPDVCSTGKLAMHTVGIRAKEAARVAYQVLDKHVGDVPAETRDADAVPVKDDARLDESTMTGAIAQIIAASEAKQPAKRNSP